MSTKIKPVTESLCECTSWSESLLILSHNKNQDFVGSGIMKSVNQDHTAAYPIYSDPEPACVSLHVSLGVFSIISQDNTGT